MIELSDNVCIIGISGGSGSGKTTFANKVLKHVEHRDVAILHMDSYYLHNQPHENYTDSGKANFDSPNAFDWNLLRYHIEELKNGRSVEMPVYDFASSMRTPETIKVGPSPVIIFEGIFSLFDREIRSMLDIKCFLHVDSDIRFTRRLHRDVKDRARSLESVIEQYYDTVRPMYEKFLAPQKQYADFIVGEETDVAAEILAARIEQIINNLAVFKPENANRENQATFQ